MDLGSVLGNVSVAGVFDMGEFERDLKTKSRAVRALEEGQGADAVTAQRVCFVVGLVGSLPYLLVLIIIPYLILSFATAPFSFLNGAIHVLLQMLFYSHIDADTTI